MKNNSLKFSIMMLGVFLLLGIASVCYGQDTVSGTAIVRDEETPAQVQARREAEQKEKKRRERAEIERTTPKNSNEVTTDNRKCVRTGKYEKGIQIIDCPPGCTVKEFRDNGTSKSDIVTDCKTVVLEHNSIPSDSRQSSQNSSNSKELAQQAREAYETWEKEKRLTSRDVYNITPSYNNAIALYRQATELDPSNAKLHSQLGIVLGMMIFGNDDGEYAGWSPTDSDNDTKNRFLEAEKELKEAIRLEPNNLKRYDALNHILDKVGEFNEPRVYKELEELNSRAARLEPTNSMWQITVADALESQGKTLQAEAKFKEVIQKFPKEAGCYGSYGWFLKNKGRYKEAEAQFRKALQFNTEDWRVEYYQKLMTEVIKLQSP